MANQPKRFANQAELVFDRIVNVWHRQFERQRPAGPELLLLVLLLKGMRDGLVALQEPSAHFFKAAAFDPYSLGIDPVGWASYLPTSLVLSHDFHRVVGVVVVVACALWASKYFIPSAAVFGALSFGLLASMRKSLAFNYIHEDLPGVACLVILAAAYFLYRIDFRETLREHQFWDSRVYPRWVTTLIFLYMGVYYSFSGLSKLIMGGWDAGNGITLQLLQFRRIGPVPALGDMIVESRSIATALMIATVILETGALVAFFNQWLRPIWCACLIGMHIAVFLGMGIPFKVNVLVLGWMAIPVDTWAYAVRSMFQRKWRLDISALERTRLGKFVVERLYAVDPIGLLRV